MYDKLNDVELTNLLHALNRATARLYFAAKALGDYDTLTELATVTEEVNGLIKLRRFITIANGV